MSWLGKFGEGHPYARPTEAELLARRRQRVAPVSRGRAMVIAAFGLLFLLDLPTWLALGLAALRPTSSNDAAILFLRILFYGALVFGVYFGYTFARYVTASICALAAVVVFAVLFKADDSGESTRTAFDLFVGTIQIAGLAAIAIGFFVLKDIRQFMQHQREKRLARSR